MIISDEQVQLAAEYLQGRPSTRARLTGTAAAAGVTPEFVQRLLFELEGIPETRGDRVESARTHLSEGLRGDEVASKMIGRIISDSLR